VRFGSLCRETDGSLLKLSSSLGFVFKRGGYDVGLGMHNASRELPQKEFDQLQHRLPQEGIASTCATDDGEWSLRGSYMLVVYGMRVL
jgi:hypothetical protein